MNNLDVSVFGLGKLGAPLAALLAAKGHRVIGVDLDPQVVEAIQAGKPLVQEPLLEDTLRAAEGRLQATTDPARASVTTITFLVMPTPSDEHGRFSCGHILHALAQCGEWLSRKSGYHLFVVVSTVSPGSMAGEIRQALEKAAGRPVGAGLGLCYNPEFIALGSVIPDMLHPDLVLIGESDAKAGSLLADLQLSLVENQPAIRRMSWVNAELAKLAVNTFVTTKISYANMLAELCERLPGADVGVVTDAIGSDRRIGRSYLSGGIGYGGPCFPRDNRALARTAADLGMPVDLPMATDRVNQHQLDRLLALVLQQAVPGSSIGVLGLAYKPGTAVTEESQGLALAAALVERGFRVVVHDFLARPEAVPSLHGAAVAATPRECWEQCEVLVITLPNPEYRDLLEAQHPLPGGPRVVVDCWRIGSLHSLPGRSLFQLGRSRAPVDSPPAPQLDCPFEVIR